MSYNQRTNFGKRLKELMSESNMSQSVLAEKIGYSQRAVSKWLIGQAEPTASAVIRCAEVFDVSCGYILGVED